MATTSIVNPTGGAYTLAVAGTDNEFLLQNVSEDKTPIMVVWAATLPAASAKGHPLYPGEGLTRNGLTGPVYVTSMTERTADVAVTEE